MAKKGITIDDLAVMVQKGFSDVTDNMATKVQLIELEKKIEKQFDKIEKIILDDHAHRIEKLESKIVYLENILNLPSKK